ncbi:MAG: ABC transporter ATP-binding protein, partial [Helicobacter sp.]|nr:ABC transporter ATP-binding protein [Helicobacter sp.]
LEEACSYEYFSCRAKVAMMFQNYCLFPHLNVEENIIFALHDIKKDKRKQKLEELLNTFKIDDLRSKRIDEISGGQAQRVAFARAIARGCDLLLLDEPFSNLDQELKNGLRMELKRLIKIQGISAIVVTHDVEDAYEMSDKVALLYDGKIIDFNSPRELFYHPKTKMSARILPDLNIIEEKLDLEDAFFRWIDSRNYIFAYTELGLGEDFKGVLLQKEFLGAFYRLKLSYKNICFFMLVSSSYPLEEGEIGFKILVS